MKICIDAGHGGNDSGAVANGRMEKADNLKMALALQKEMIKRGHSVLMTRTDDSYPSLNARADMANNWGADAFISIHRNAPTTGKGYEVLFGSNASQKSKDMGQRYIDKVIPISGFVARRNGKPFQQGATVLQRSKMPANTVEVGFVGNATDDAILDGKFSAIISAHADALEAMFGAAVPVPVPQPVTPTWKEGPVRDYISRLYMKTLGRQPDAAGLINWTNAIMNNLVTPKEAAHGFYFSEENIKQADPNAVFIFELYWGLLNRAPDTAGGSEWERGLFTKHSREDVFNGVANSAEFAAIVEGMKR